MLNIIIRRLKKLQLHEIFGILGFIPFIIIIFLIFTNKDDVKIYLDLAIFYLFIIISFIGATYWGLAISSKKNKSRLIIFSVIPSIIVTFIYFLNITIPVKLVIGILFLNFIFFYEKSFFKNELPKWYLNLRRNLNFLVTSTILIIIFLH